MLYVYGLIVVALGCFAFVLLVGPPYVPTLTPQLQVALDMLEPSRRQRAKAGLDTAAAARLLELGCGDGKVLVAAAQRGWLVTGIELNPILVMVCLVRTWRYRKQVKVYWGNYWNTSLWDDADAIFGFVLPKYMAKLDRTIEQWRQSRAVSLASFAFKIPDKHIAKEQSGVFLYSYLEHLPKPVL